MLKQVFENSASGVDSPSIMYCHSNSEIRNNFLNRSFSDAENHNESSNEDESESSKEQFSESESSQSKSSGYKFHSPIYRPSMQLDVGSIGKYQSKNKMHELRSNESESADFGISKLNYSESPLKRQQSKEKISTMNSNFVPVESTNYRAMFKKQLQKNRKLEQKMMKDNLKMANMSMLIEKLKQQNKILYKMLGKQPSNSKTNKKKEKTLNKNKSYEHIFCECGETRMPEKYPRHYRPY